MLTNLKQQLFGENYMQIQKLLISYAKYATLEEY